MTTLKPLPPLQAVLLDVGGTLIDSEPSPPEVYAEVLGRWGRKIPVDRVTAAFRTTWMELTQLHPPGLDRYHLLKGGEREWWGEFVRRVMATLEHPAPWQPVLEELFAAFADPALWRVYPEVEEVLSALRRKGCRLAAVSNWDSRLPGILEGLSLARHFDALLVSALEGVEKPSPVIFHRAAAQLGVEVGGCVHVGDSPLDDYRGAESAGMTSVLLDRHGLFADGYRRISDLRGLYALVN
ncbi:MAG TPA: HAD-IA family hydrolase [Thermoanaerobaculaceae bacterium]|nr:HAD-IA family hydrolase [Thermoanaerobaculaceae bacterium]HPS78514.1 HAD-IA family hydrolase [Thermoanaerobaculaceae bacterium]